MKKAAAEVIARIQALPETEALTLADKDVVEAAKAAYEALTSEQKSLVGEELKTQLEEKYARIQELEEEEKNRKYFPENVTIRFETNDGTVLGKTKMGGKEAKTLKALGVTGGLEANEPDYTTPIHLLAQALLENQLPVNINVNQAGWVNELNGLGGDVMYYINGADSSQMMGAYPLKKGDDIVVIQCSNDGGKYTGFGYFGDPVDSTYDPIDMTEEILIKTGSDLKLRYSYKGWDSGNSYAAGADLYISGNGLPTATEKLDVTTDENGYATISFPEAGTYVVSARAFVKAGDETSGRLASNAYCRVTVTDTGEPEPEPLKGDMNGDGKLTLVDAVQLLDKITAEETVDTGLADMNGDGKITLVDAITLLDLVTAGNDQE